jgi:iron complex outermembrane receptor protein
VQVIVDGYYSKFQNRIVSSFDPDLGITIDRNIGSVHIKGFDAGVTWQLAPYLSYTGNFSYNKSIVQSDTPGTNNLPIPTKGKFLVETPKYQWFQRVEWDVNDQVSLGVQAKWVGERWATDVNDERSPAYSTVDADLRWSVPESLVGDHRIYVQGNVKNLFDKKYFGSISSVTNAVAIPASSAGSVRYSLGAPRTYEISLHAEF